MSILELNGKVSAALRAMDRIKPASRRLTRLRGMVLLSGRVRTSGFSAAVGRSLLDLPVDPEHTLLDLWQAHAAIQVAHAGLERLELRIITNDIPPAPRRRSQVLPLSVERDPRDIRGTGGVVRDVVESYDNDDLVIVVSANQILNEALPDLLSAMSAAGGDVTVMTHDDGTPSGMMLARCGALRAIPHIGFIDLKEQGLKLIARKHSVKVVTRGQGRSWPVRTAGDYIAALRDYHRDSTAPTNGHGRFAEDWEPRFSIVEADAEVDPSARIHDSVVLRGAKVERGALVARSVVGPGSVVRANRTSVDQVVGVGFSR